MKITIKGATICDERSPWHLKEVNVIVENGTISYVGEEDKSEGKVINGRGKWLSPGWFDLWASFCDPGYEHKEDLTSGSTAAMQGGFTGVAVLPGTDPVTETKNNLKYILNGNHSRVSKLFPLAAVSRGASGSEITEMIDLFEHGAVAFTNGPNPVDNTALMVKALQYLQKFDGLLLQRPVDTALSKFGMVNEGTISVTLGMPGIPAMAEELVLKRDLDLLEYAGGKIHFALVSTKGSVEMIRKAKKSGYKVSCSVASYQLIHTEEAVGAFDTNFKVNPPLRTAKDLTALKKGLSEGTISVIVSGHNPQDQESKVLEFDLAEFGMISLQTVAPDLASLSKSVPMETLLRAVTLGPRELINIETPVIAKDNRVELTLFDPSKKWLYDATTNQSKSSNSPYLGKELTGCIELVVNGKDFWHNPLFS